jgi:hypothetical protein
MQYQRRLKSNPLYVTAVVAGIDKKDGVLVLLIKPLKLVSLEMPLEMLIPELCLLLKLTCITPIPIATLLPTRTLIGTKQTDGRNHKSFHADQ